MFNIEICFVFLVQFLNVDFSCQVNIIPVIAKADTMTPVPPILPVVTAFTQFEWPSRTLTRSNVTRRPTRWTILHAVSAALYFAARAGSLLNHPKSGPQLSFLQLM